MIEDARKELIDLSSDFMQEMLEQKKLIQSLREQATRDALTDLFNYQSFQESLEREVYRAKRYKLQLSLIIADIDHFKNINDKHGHLAGDRTLKCVAKSLKESLRKSDIIARYGGEEFAVIMPETSPEDSLIVAERLRETVDALRIDYEGEGLSVTMSFGVAFVDHQENPSKEDLIKRADEGLYHSKNSGRNKCSFLSGNSDHGLKACSSRKSIPSQARD
jgi:diguanylate cyclase (GGDEF)-like protein